MDIFINEATRPYLAMGQGGQLPPQEKLASEYILWSQFLWGGS